MKLLRSCVTLMILSAGLVAPAIAQQTESRITGRVLDQSKAALPGVTVTVTSKATGAVRTDVTDGEGGYTVTNLGPGACTVVIELAGFAPKTREVVLGVGQIERVEVDLNVATITSGLAPAESGLGSGGNITVISKSGSNGFGGSIFEYKRDDALDAANKYDDIKQPLTLDQFGGSFGGPLVSTSASARPGRRRFRSATASSSLHAMIDGTAAVAETFYWTS